MSIFNSNGFHIDGFLSELAYQMNASLSESIYGFGKIKKYVKRLNVNDIKMNDILIFKRNAIESPLNISNKDSPNCCHFLLLPTPVIWFWSKVQQ